jgi:dTDP-4-amino-4,6-dideoxygalactose transaminase
VPEVVLPAVRDDCKPVWHLFVVQVDNRDAVQQALADKGIATALHYPVPLHLQRAYARMNLSEGAFPVAEACAKRLLSLPMYAELADDQIDYVCRSLIEAVRK